MSSRMDTTELLKVRENHANALNELEKFIELVSSSETASDILTSAVNKVTETAKEVGAYEATHKGIVKHQKEKDDKKREEYFGRYLFNPYLFGVPSLEVKVTKPRAKKKTKKKAK